MKAATCLKNLFILAASLLITFAASSCKNTFTTENPTYYTITVAQGIENGSISTDKSSATKGESIKITATAGSGYELSALSVIDSNGNAIPVTDNSFTMPEGNVTVSATFASIFHNIYIAENIENGSVSTDKESAAQGETVTVAAEPDEGYLLDSIHVTDADGNVIAVTDNTFKMPKAHVTVSAIFSLPSYEIKIAETIENGSVSTDKSSATAGETVTIETDPQEGYQLEDLYAEDSNGIPVEIEDNMFVMPAANVTINAEFIPVIYKVNVTGSIANGSISTDKSSATIGETIKITSSPEEGYELYMLSVTDLDGNSVKVTNKRFQMPAGHVIVSASFVPVHYKISTAASIQNGSISTNRTSANAGEEVQIIATPAAGYALNVVTVTDTTGSPVQVTGGTFVMPAANVIVNAIFVPAYYSISPASDITNGTVSADKTSAAAGQTVTVSASPNSGYTLGTITARTESGSSVSIENNTFTMPIGNVVITATFTPIMYSVSIAGNIANGTITADKSSASVGQTVTISASPSIGYKLASITATDSSGVTIPVTGNSFAMPAGNVSVSATFTQIQYEIRLADGIENGTVSVDRNSATIGQTVTITASPATGYKIESISAKNSNGNSIYIENNTFTMPVGTVVVSATFTPIMHAVNIAGGIEHGSLSTNKNQAGINQSVSITASPDAGYKLTSLSVKDSYGSPIAIVENSFTMPNGSVTVSAVFTAIQYSVSIASTEHGSISVDKTTAIIGETVTVTTSPEPEYRAILSITDSNGNQTDVTGTSFTMPAGNVTVCATFKPLVASLKTGTEINSILIELGANSTATQFLPSENPPSAGETVYLISTEESEIPVYVWLTETTINYYAPTKQLIPLNPLSDNLFKSCYSLEAIDLRGFDTSSVTTMSYMFSGCTRLTSLNVSGFDTSSVTNMGSMFRSCTGLTSLDISGFDTSSVTNMGSMFNNCSGLTSLDLSTFDTSSVTYMGGMFVGCKGLTSLDLSTFDTSSVTNMGSMFLGCTGLTSLDISGFDTSSVTDMSAMFLGYTGLSSLDLSGFDTSSVTDMSAMFASCTGLTSLDLSGFDTSSVTNMGSMFNNCSGLTSLNLSGFDTSSVTNMYNMFNGCTGLTSLNLSGFDTSSVTNMSYMFSNCTGLTSLNLSGFDTSSVTDMSAMFKTCTGLTTIYASTSFNTDTVTSSADMFYSCTKLKGGKGTTYNYSHRDKTYARIDGGTSSPGYFTKK